MAMRIDGVDIDAYLEQRDEATKLKSPRNGGGFWSSGARPQTDPAVDVMEVTYPEPKTINYINFLAARFPHTIRIEFHDGRNWVPVRMPSPSPDVKGLTHDEITDIATAGKGGWGDPFSYTVTWVTPTFIYGPKKNQIPHPQHYGAGHWERITVRTLTFSASRVRFLLKRAPGTTPRDGLTRKPVPYSLAIRALELGYRVAAVEDVPSINYDLTFNSTTDLLGTRVAFSLLSSPARQAISINGRGWRSEPQPFSHAVVNFYVDVRGADGEAQVIDGFQIDPLTLGPNISLYWSNDEPDDDYTSIDEPITYPLAQSHDTSPQGQRVSQSVDGGGILFQSSASYITVDNTYLQFSPSRPWWLGLSLRSLFDATGTDEYGTSQHPILSFGEATLLVDGGEIQFLRGNEVLLRLPLDPDHNFESAFTLTLSSTADNQVEMTYMLTDHERVSETWRMDRDLARPDHVRIGGFQGSDPGMPAMVVRGLVLKTDREMTEEEFLVLSTDHSALCGPVDVPWRDTPLVDNALLRMHPRFFDVEANPLALVGGPGDQYAEMVWAPVPRDYVLKRGTMRLPPTKSKHFKFEMTNLVAEHYESFVPIQRNIKMLPATLKSMDVRNGTVGAETPDSANAPGLDVDKNLTTQAFSDNPKMSPDTSSSQTTRTEALTITNPVLKEKVADAGWVWRYQNWHVGSAAPRFVEVSKHVYEEISIEQKTKIGYFAGIKSIRAVRADYTTPFDAGEIVESFRDTTHIGEVSGAVIEGEVLKSSTARSTTTSVPFNSARPIRGIQFASVQSEARLISPTTEVFTPFGDASIAPHADGSTQVTRGYHRVSYGDIDGGSFFTATDMLLRTNQMKNSTLRGVTGRAEIRRNIATAEIPNPVGDATVVTETYQGEPWWRVSASTANHGARKMIDLAELTNGQTYTASWEVLNTSATAVSVVVDMSDAGTTVYSIAPGENRRVWATGSRDPYTTLYRFSDLALTTPGSSILVRNILIERGNRPRPFFNGNSPSDAGLAFSWLGDPATSPSTAIGDKVVDPYGYSTEAPAWITPAQSPGGGSIAAVYPQYGNNSLILLSSTPGKVTSTPGRFWSVRMKARVVGGLGTEQIAASLRMYNAAGSTIAEGTEVSVTSLSSSLVEITCASAVATPSTIDSLRLLVTDPTSTWLNSMGRLEFSDIIIEEVAAVGEVAGPFFSGSTKDNEEGFDHRWEGEADASTSGLYALSGYRDTTYDDLEALTYFEIEGTLRGGLIVGGVEAPMIDPPSSGVIYGSTIVTAPATATEPVTITSQIVSSSGEVLAQGDEVVAPGTTADIIVEYPVGSAIDLHEYSQIEDTTSSYTTLEEGTWGNVENAPIRGALTLRTIQQGISSGHAFSVVRSGIFETTVQWQFSVDAGATWFDGLSVRNNVHGVLSFPTSGKSLLWRAILTDEHATVSALAIRPWYGVYDRGEPHFSDTLVLGPNRAPSEVYQPIETDPMWKMGAVEIPAWWYQQETQGPPRDIDNEITGGGVDDEEFFLDIDSHVDDETEGGPEMMVLEGY